MLKRKQTNDGLDGARGAKGMPHYALGRAQRHTIEQGADCLAFGCIVESRGLTMRIDVINLGGGNLRALKSPLHCLSRSDARWLRLCDVKVVCGNTVTDDFRENRRTALASEVEIFQGRTAAPSPSTMPDRWRSKGGISPALRLEANQSRRKPFPRERRNRRLTPVGNDRSARIQMRDRSHLSPTRRRSRSRDTALKIQKLSARRSPAFAPGN